MFEFSEKSQKLQNKLLQFMDEYIYPNETIYKAQLNAAKNPFATTPLIKELKQKAKNTGLWNLFIPEEHSAYSPHGGLTFTDYAPLAEIMGRVIWCSEVFNCNAPDTGNMEVFMNFATKKQQEKWLNPLLNGEIHSSYAMTEPNVASSDATNIELSIEKDADEWVLNGHKWFITGAQHEDCKIFIVMGKSDANNPNRHKQQTQILVPKDTPGLKIMRSLTTLGYDDAPLGHAEVLFENVRVPLENVLLGEGRGFEIAQGRLAPGRMHHCMRLVGAAQRSLEITCQRASTRATFGRPLSKHQSVREDISKSFSEIEMARLLVLKTCYSIDNYGIKESINHITATKTTIPALVQNVIDKCIQIHGAGGLTEDYCLAEAFNYARYCRIADGPDQVHQMSLGKKIIDKYSSIQQG
ncbi:acyl-CoA dehydrogenase family protein [Thalassotalea profundi]|uniref:Acyl-CoA dehydrogenase n=1 Tax=Thalassotalea profundi TaxID=2036687 RepID=A0ABQ3ITY5_9GAMM|nr:acyl-CoA dehydrogenase family protein [Thalassotalea profundi]GHE90849.1 acyl-CoA dehydrogenase [Thalassotalea profundi]